MPRPNFHSCELLPDSTPKDRVRTKHETIDGKPVSVIYYIKDNKAKRKSVLFPKSSWDADAARAHCSGTFVPAGKAAATLVFIDEGPAQAITLAVAPSAEETETQELVWHPVIYVGRWEHSSYGEFEVKLSDLEEMVSNFEAGVPLQAGVPIDENGVHDVRGEGAFGWIEKLEIREDALWAGIKWTQDGIAAIEDGRYKYLSASFYIGENPYAETSTLQAGALCTRPFFSQQPELRVAASEYSYALGNEAMSAADDSREKARAAQRQRAKRWGIQILSDTNLTPPAAYRDECPNPSDYGDPVNYKYPLKPESRLRNAPARMAQNYGVYNVKSRRIIWNRIIRRQKASGIKHKWGSPLALDRLLAPDLAAWAKRGRNVAATRTGGSVMNAEEARAKYVELKGEVTDEEWEKITEGIETEEDWEILVASFVEEEGEGSEEEGGEEGPLEEQLAEAQAKVKELEQLVAEEQKAKDEALAATQKLTERVDVLEKENKEAKLREEISAVDLGGNRRYSPAAVDLLVAAQLNPGEESIKAIQAHMEEHGGSMDTVIMGEVGAVSAVTATGKQSDEQWWQQKKQSITPETAARVEAAVASEKSKTFRAAYEETLL